jgi:hypothetical protein
MLMRFSKGWGLKTPRGRAPGRHRWRVGVGLGLLRAQGVQGLLQVLAGRGVPAQLGLVEAEGEERGGFAGLVAGLPDQGQCLFVVVDGLLVTAQPGFDVAEIAQDTGDAGDVAGLLEKVQDLLVELSAAR